MKILLSSILVLLCISGSLGFLMSCGSTICGEGQLCVAKGGFSNCVLLTMFSNIAVVQTSESTWVDQGNEYTLFRVQIVNYGKQNVTNVVLGTDSSLDLRDDESIWKVNIDPFGDLSLPDWCTGVEAGKTFTFGYIVNGRTSPNMRLKRVTF
eukprot:gene7540-9271_t